MPLSVACCVGGGEISFPPGSGGHRGEDVLLLEVEVAPVFGALESLQGDRRGVCKINTYNGSAVEPRYTGMVKQVGPLERSSIEKNLALV